MISAISKLIPGIILPTLPKTDWTNLAWPYLCGLLSENPSKYSATMHNSGFKFLSLPFSYHSFKVSDLEVPMNAIKDLGIRGFSVTIPYKEEVIPYLDFIGPAALSIGACNTIINDGNKIHGFNTDWLGVALPLSNIKTDFSNDTALIIGAGGASKAAIYALKKIGIKKITVSNRTVKRFKNISSDFSSPNFQIETISNTDLVKKGLKEFSLIINSTPLTSMSFFPYKEITDKHIIFEMITGETDLTKIGSKKNAIVIPGIKMLLAQGLFQFRYFTEKEPPEKEMEQKLEEYYKFLNSNS